MCDFDIMRVVSIQVVISIAHTLKHDFTIPTVPEGPFGPQSSTVRHRNSILLSRSSEAQVTGVMGVHPLTSGREGFDVYDGVEAKA